MNSNGLPQVDIDKCTACPDCTNACPRDLFVVVPLSQKLFVQCSIPLAGEAATSLCATACDACEKCVADASPDLIRMEDNLPVVDYSTNAVAKPEAVFRCATNSIKWIDGNQFEEQENLPIGGKKRYA
jgi:NAD-dependent dihydropyrimidine dehydrogenase PreA subunit